MERFAAFILGVALFCLPLYTHAESMTVSNEQLLISLYTQLINLLKQQIALVAHSNPNPTQPQASAQAQSSGSSGVIMSDKDAPEISAIASTTDTTSATITWTTDEPATSVINYGPTTNYGSTQSDSTFTTSHSITLTGLTDNTTYHFQVSSADKKNNTAAASDATCRTTYRAAAVHFDGNTYLIRNSLVATDNNTLSASLWYKNSTPGDIAFFAVDPAGAYVTYLYSYFNDPTEGVGMGTLAGDKRIISGFDFMHNEMWHHVVFSANSSTGVVKVYLDDINVTNILSNDAPFVTPINGLPFYICNDPYDVNCNGDIADFWIAPGISLLDGNGDIATSTRRKFIDENGKPVDLGSDGSTPTGATPAVFLSGNATEFGTNRGTGGAFTTTGTLTNATSSPSD